MNKYLPVLIFFILANVVGDNAILQVFGNQAPFNALTLSTGMLILQMFSAPIQAGFSDFYCRKKSLIVSLSFSFLSVLLLFFTNLYGAISILFFIMILIINGLFGNTVPLVWSALADTQEKNLRFSLALSTVSYAVGYMILTISDMDAIANIFGQSWVSSASTASILFALSIVFCIYFFYDVRDRKIRHTGLNKDPEYLKIAFSEFVFLWKDLSSQSTRFGLLAYFLWATSQYSILILLTDFQNKHTLTVISMMAGYLLGVVILGFCKNIKDQTMIRMGFILSALSLSLFFIVNPFLKTIYIPLSICYFFYSIGNAFLSPSILSLFSKERLGDQQGKGFGLVVSADSGGFLAASVIVIIFNYLKIGVGSVVIFSFIIFLISWFPYLKYEHLRKDRVINHDK